MNSLRLIFLIGLSVFAPNCPAASGADAGPTPAQRSDRLRAEFEGSFPLRENPNGVVRKVELRAAEFDSGILPPYRARVWGYNRQIPGPVIRIDLGDTLEVKLINDLPEPTTIHWHGVRVANEMDGVPDVTQKPVASGESFTYRITPKDPGTFWFHPHFRSSEQIEKGLHGALIVEDRADPPYSRDLVWILDDWLLQPDGSIYDQFVTRHDLAHDGRWGNFMTINGQYRPVFRVKAGERVRLRLINVANGRVFAPKLAGIRARVIAVDGMKVPEPFPLQNFLLAPGNRLDLDLVIPVQSAGTRFSIEDRFGQRTFVLGSVAVDSTAIVETPDFEPPRAARFPDWLQAEQVSVDHEFLLDAERGGPYGISWTIDGHSWPEAEPLDLHSRRFYKLRFRNLTGRLHPMHLHGQFFRVIARDGRPMNEKFWRDTVLIGPNESVDIALVPIDTGTWANHCHILEHAEAGMMTVLRVQ